MRIREKLGYLFISLLVIFGGIHLASAEAVASKGKLIVERTSDDGQLGQPISIELTPARSRNEAPRRISLKKQPIAEVSLSPGWIQVNCRPLRAKEVQGHSVKIEANRVTRVRCFFAVKSKAPPIALSKKEQTGKLDVESIFVGTGGLNLESAATADYADRAGIQIKRARLGKAGRPASPHAYRGSVKRQVLMSGQVDVMPEYNREGYSHQTENRFRDVQLSPLSTFSVDVDTAAYTNVRRFIEGSGRLPPVGAIRIEEMVNYFEYAYAKPHGDEPFSVHTEVSAAPWNSNNRLVHIGMQAPTIPLAEAPPLNLVFLIDVSGSMRAPNKLPLLKRGFAMMVSKLRAKDRVSIVVYASREGVVLPSTPGNQKQLILDALSELQAGGSTNGAAGIKLAYQEARKAFTETGTNRIILATDGDFNVGASSQAELVAMVEKERMSGVYLSVIGFGRGNYQDDRMESLSNHGNGFAAYIDGEQEAKRVFERQITGTLLTVAKDVKVQVEFNPAKVKSYRLIGYANRQLASEDFKDDKKDAGDMGSGHSVTVLYEVVPKTNGDAEDFEQPLRYQNGRALTPRDGELLSLKVRYKTPQGKKSKLLERILVDHDSSVSETSNAFRFSAAVAQFGMLLRSSKHKGSSSFLDAIRLAEGALGVDSQQERAAFVRLVQSARSLGEK